MTYVITGPCVDVKDKACLDECPVDCIYEGNRMLYIHPDECVDCGACEPVCPVEAIYYEDDVPEQWQHYVQMNEVVFEAVGSPGGASKVGFLPDPIPVESRTLEPYSLPQLPEVRYLGMAREFAAIDPAQPGEIALLDAELASARLGELDGLINVLLLFYDRVLVISETGNFHLPGGRMDRLLNAGLVEYSEIDAWVVENSDTLLRACAALTPGTWATDRESRALARAGIRQSRGWRSAW